MNWSHFAYKVSPKTNFSRKSIGTDRNDRRRRKRRKQILDDIVEDNGSTRSRSVGNSLGKKL